MLIYEHERTEQIVSRLMKTEKIMRVITIISFALILAPIGQFCTRQFNVTEAIPFGMILGAAIGILVGQYSSMLISAIIEWGAGRKRADPEARTD
jgi:Na+/H+ antiporter NhaC